MRQSDCTNLCGRETTALNYLGTVSIVNWIRCFMVTVRTRALVGMWCLFFGVKLWLLCVCVFVWCETPTKLLCDPKIRSHSTQP